MVSKYSIRLLFLLLTTGLSLATVRGDVPCSLSCCERLAKHITFLGSLHPQCQRMCIAFIEKNELAVQCPLFLSCIDSMRKKGSFSPFCDCWKSFEREIVTCPEMCQESVLREYASSVLVSYLALAAIQKRFLIVDVVMLYMKVSALPLEKILDLLDEYCSLMYESLQNYTLEKPYNLTDWVKEYWWVPSLIGGVSLVSFIRWLRKREAKREVNEVNNEVKQ